MGKNRWYSCAFKNQDSWTLTGSPTKLLRPTNQGNLPSNFYFLKKDCLLWTQPANYPFVSFQKVNKLVIKVISVSDLDVRKEANGSIPPKKSVETEMSLRKMVFEG